MEQNNLNMQFVKRDWLKFIINANQKIVIEFATDDVIHCCYWAKIYFVYYNHKILLTKYDLVDNIRQFIKVLDLTLQHALILDAKFYQDIGFLWNFICRKPYSRDQYSDQAFLERDQFNSYLVFSSSDFATWLYNDHKGNIILQITPMFPIGNPRNKIPKYNTFLHWMKTSYTSKVTCIISQDTARRWFEQLKKINDVAQHNINEMFKDVD